MPAEPSAPTGRRVSYYAVPKAGWARRSARLGLLAGVAVMLLVPPAPVPKGGREPPVVRQASAQGTSNAIDAENRRPGSASWRIDHPSSGVLEGFASRTSVAPGESVDLYVSSSPATFSVEVYRMGWYGGAGGRLMWERRGLAGVRQPVPAPDPRTKMVEARWAPSVRVPVGAGWTTGEYLAKLSDTGGGGSYVPFVVREGTSRAPLLFQSSVTTWQAYNGWGGHSLYLGKTRSGPSAAGRSTVVSFDRPYAWGSGAADFLGLEYPLLEWLEEEGYDVGYATDVDMHEDPGLLAGRRAFLSLGHDEYWSTAMRRSVESALASGVNLAFMGANAMYRHIRLDPSPLGPDRREVNYRSARDDPVTATNPAESTVQWRDPPVRRPEDAILGAMYECNPVRGDLRVYDPLPWLFEGTGLRPGDRVRGLLGPEYDRVFSDRTRPERMWALFRSPLACGGRRSVQETTFWRAPSGAGVFDAGTSRFLCAFSGCRGAPPSLGVQRLVRNLLDSYVGGVRPSPEPEPLPAAEPGPPSLPASSGPARAAHPPALPTPRAPRTPRIVEPTFPPPRTPRTPRPPVVP